MQSCPPSIIRRRLISRHAADRTRFPAWRRSGQREMRPSAFQATCGQTMVSSANHCNRRSGSRLLADIYCCRRPAGTLVALDLISRLSSSAFCPIANPTAKVRALSILLLTALQSGALGSVILPPSQKPTHVLVAATIARRLGFTPHRQMSRTRQTAVFRIIVTAFPVSTCLVPEARPFYDGQHGDVDVTFISAMHRRQTRARLFYSSI